MNFQNLLKGEYWFSVPFPAEAKVYWIWVAGLLLITALGFFSLLSKSFIKDKVFSLMSGRVGDVFIPMGIVGLILFFLRQESVPLFSWRIWFLFWALIFAYFIFKILKYYFVRIPDIKKFEEDRARKEKYLP